MAKKPNERRSAQDRNHLVLRACELFLCHKSATGENLTVAEVAEQLTAEEQKERRAPVSSQDVYTMLRRGRDLGMLRLVPETNKALKDRLIEQYRLKKIGVHVVDVGESSAAGELVAETAADVVLDLLNQLQRATPGQPVGLGLGTGRFTLHFSQCLSRAMRSAEKPPKIGLHAITAAAPARSPHYSPVGFFNLFPNELVTRRVGLFAEPFVSPEVFAEMKAQTTTSQHWFAFREAYGLRDQIDVVVTSLGDPRQGDNLYRKFLIATGINVDQFLQQHRCVGDIQYRPYSAEAPIKEGTGQFRAVTLFDIEDYYRLAKEKHVVLMVRRSLTGESRINALLPLLKSDQLRVFSELVIDSVTCKELIDEARGQEAG